MAVKYNGIYFECQFGSLDYDTWKSINRYSQLITKKDLLNYDSEMYGIATHLFKDVNSQLDYYRKHNRSYENRTFNLFDSMCAMVLIDGRKYTELQTKFKAKVHRVYDNKRSYFYKNKDVFVRKNSFETPWEKIGTKRQRNYSNNGATYKYKRFKPRFNKQDNEDNQRAIRGHEEALNFMQTYKPQGKFAKGITVVVSASVFYSVYLEEYHKINVISGFRKELVALQEKYGAADVRIKKSIAFDKKK